jgi:L-asparaginase / beta-aspartyl-peptidase
MFVVISGISTYNFNMTEQYKSLVIHGGAGFMDLNDPDDRKNLDDKQIALKRIVNQGKLDLANGMPAIDVVTNAVMALEDDPAFNAGYGAAIGLDASGNPFVSLDASIMVVDKDGHRFGGVTGITIMQNPILAARHLLDEPTNLVHGDAANNIARDVAKTHGLNLVANSDLITDYKLKKLQTLHVKKESEESEGGTVGVVAFDGTTIVAGTSTGGITGKRYGRVGDSCIPGAGTYADHMIGASATGYGEKILLHGTTRHAIDLAHEGKSLQDAAEIAVRELQAAFDGRGGIIMTNARGEIGIATNTEQMPNAFWTNTMAEPEVRIK